MYKFLVVKGIKYCNVNKYIWILNAILLVISLFLNISILVYYYDQIELKEYNDIIIQNNNDYSKEYIENKINNCDINAVEEITIEDYKQIVVHVNYISKRDDVVKCIRKNGLHPNDYYHEMKEEEKLLIIIKLFLGTIIVLFWVLYVPVVNLCYKNNIKKMGLLSMLGYKRSNINKIFNKVYLNKSLILLLIPFIFLLFGIIEYYKYKLIYSIISLNIFVLLLLVVLSGFINYIVFNFYYYKRFKK